MVLLIAVAGCQKTDPSGIQPERLTSADGTGRRSAAAPPSQPSAAALTATAKAMGSSAPTSAPTELAAGNTKTRGPGPLLPYATAQPSPKKPKGKKAQAAAGSTEVKLLDAGKAPHSKLRFRVKKGQTEKLTMTTETAIKVKVDGKAAPTSKLPVMVMGMSMTVTDTKANGDIRYKFNLDSAAVKSKAGIPPDALKKIEQVLGKLKGLGGRSLVSSRGVQKESKFIVPANIDPQTKQLMQGMEQGLNQVLAPFPKEAVGVGARWRHSSTIKQGGIKLHHKATYELLELDPKTGRLALKVVVKQKAPKQKVASPLGVTLDLLSLSSKGSGTSKLRLDRLAPSQSNVSVTTKLKMALPKAKKMTLLTKMGVLITSP